MARVKTEEDAQVGAALRRIRNDKGWSQDKLATALGITFQQIQKYENGTNRVSAGRLKIISDLFGVPINAFFDTASEVYDPDVPAGTLTLRAFMGLLSDLMPEYGHAYVALSDPNIRGRLIPVSDPPYPSTAKVIVNEFIATDLLASEGKRTFRPDYHSDLKQRSDRPVVVLHCN